MRYRQTLVDTLYGQSLLYEKQKETSFIFIFILFSSSVSKLSIENPHPVCFF